MATGRKRGSLDELTPEQKAKVEAARSKWHSPEAREAEVRDRESLAEELRTKGAIETDGTSIDPAELIRPKSPDGR